MSYDVRLKAKVENEDMYVPLGDSHNITWNVRELILKSSGWEIQNCQFNGKASDLAIKIQHGIKELSQRPHLYKQYEAENGWGTVEGTLGFYERLLPDLLESPFAYVYVN